MLYLCLVLSNGFSNFSLKVTDNSILMISEDTLFFLDKSFDSYFRKLHLFVKKCCNPIHSLAHVCMYVTCVCIYVCIYVSNVTTLGRNVRFASNLFSRLTLKRCFPDLTHSFFIQYNHSICAIV